MFEEQCRLEADMRDATVARFYRQHEKAEEREEMADTVGGRSLFDLAFDHFHQSIDTWVADKKAGKAGRKPRAALMIEEFGDSRTLAYIFLRHVISVTLTLSANSRAKAPRTTRVVLQATQAVHDELRMRYFAEQRRPLLKRIVADFQRRDLPRRRRRELMIRQFNTQQLEWQADGWGQSERLNLGVVLLDLMKSSTGLVEEFIYYEGVKTIKCLAFTQALQNVFLEKMEKVSTQFTVYLPMVVPPRDWNNSALVGGGYHTDNVKPYRFVKGSKIKYLQELENVDLSKVLDPINALQSTPWRVNPVMVEVLDHVFSRSLKVKGLPPADDQQVPAPPPGIEDSEELAAEYRRDCYMVHDTNRRMISKRISILRMISMARRFAQYENIYFPYDLDSRGRAYPKVPFLNPQGADYAKSLLEFAEGKPIETPEHEAYLAIAVANAWGQDKLALQDRVKWVEENEVMLQEIALNPTGDLRWMEADEPFMALRGALEWRGLCEHGTGYVSHMPVHFDATCSGLQHFSALLLDAEGGFHVNLTGHEDRQDIYAAVAEKATATLKVDTSDIARVALEMGISRSLCKRPVMIVPYAGTFSSCMAYVGDHYRERAEDGEVLPVDMDVIRREVVPLVAKHVWEAIGNTVIAARQAMDWITSSGRVVSKSQNAPIQWTTPDGFIIQQAKYEEKERRVKTYLDGGRVVRTTVSESTPVLDARKMAQSLSPNYIHSLDACHMRITISKAMEIGGMSFAMIHDSFGVHAADMSTFLNDCIKPAFVEMYRGRDLLALFSDEIKFAVTEEDREKFTEVPSKGALDIEEVLDSQFFFS